MARFVARDGKGRDFVSFKADGLESFKGGCKEAEGEVSCWSLYFPFVEGGVGFNGEVIEGEVVDGEVSELVEGVAPRFFSLAWKVVHEVDGDVFKARFLGVEYGLPGFFSRVDPFEGLERSVVERLDAEA